MVDYGPVSPFPLTSCRARGLSPRSEYYGGLGLLRWHLLPYCTSAFGLLRSIASPEQLAQISCLGLLPSLTLTQPAHTLHEEADEDIFPDFMSHFRFRLPCRQPLGPLLRLPDNSR